MNAKSCRKAAGAGTPRPWVPTGVFLATVFLTTVLLVTVACSGPSDSTSPSRRPGESARPAAPSRPAESAGPTTDTLTAEPVGDQRDLPEPFFGFNGASIVQPVNAQLLMEPELQGQLADFPTRLVRIPAGTTAQWIDWRTGRFIDAPTSPFAQVTKDRPPITMGDWSTFLQKSGAEPVWDLNVLNSTLDDQIAMLEEAERLGLPVRFVELGNELWDPRGTYPEMFPTGADYAAAMNEWIPALRQRFPDIEIAVSGADLADETFTSVLGARYNDWNNDVLSTVRGADAIAVHPYWILPEGQPPGSDVASTLTAGLDHWQRVQDLTLGDLPEGMDVWLTEWSQAGHFVGSGKQIWAQALSVIAVGLQQLSDPRVTMSLVHNIVDGTANPHDIGVTTVFPSFTNGETGTPRLARTALGHALPLMFGAVSPGSKVKRLRIDDAPRVGDHPGVIGVAILGRKPGAVFVNLTGKKLTVDLPESLQQSLIATTASAPPESAPSWSPPDHVTEFAHSIDGHVTLPAYSVVRLAGG